MVLIPESTEGRRPLPLHLVLTTLTLYEVSDSFFVQSKPYRCLELIRR